MPDIHIQRDHRLGLRGARKLASRWADMAQERLDMSCNYEEGDTCDRVSFSRSGVNGELKVTGDMFELDARLGLLLGVFKERIETEIARNLDDLLAQEEAMKENDVDVARHPARAPKAAKPPAARRKS